MWSALRDRSAGQAVWGERFSSDMRTLHPAVVPWVNNFLTLVATEADDFQQAAAYRMHAQQAALDTGQVWLAIYISTSIGASFNTLHDHHAALEWMQRGLSMARPTGWPYSIGECLTQTAETLRHLKRPEAAQELLNEALVILAPLANSRTYALAMQCLADLALDRGDNLLALNSFRQLRQRADAITLLNFQFESRRGQAHALARLGQTEAALATATEALQLAQQQDNTHYQITALQALAEIHCGHQPASADIALGYLQQALAIANGNANTIVGYAIPSALLDAVAKAHNRIGDYEQAWHTSMQAIAAREKTLSLEATNRAIAVQVRHQTERAQATSEHHRQLAASEARRAEILQQTSATLELLSLIGQEITAHRDANAVFEALNRHLNALLDANYIVIYLIDADGQSLRSAYRIKSGLAMSASRIMLSDESSYCVRCLRERREINVNTVQNMSHANKSQLPAPLPKAISALFAPLAIAERVLGVLSIQAAKDEVYGEREQMIFRTLCAYGAIALDNANAYRQLKLAQEQLVAQEKLAALGALVAGVAHEVNTPISNSLMMVSTLQERTVDITTQLHDQSLRHADLVVYLDEAQEACKLILRGLTSAADLVNSFKQVAMDRSNLQHRVFNLAQTSHEIVATMNNQIRTAGHKISIDIPDTIKLNSYPGPYGQVIANLINNALLHGFEGKTQGRMYLTAHQDCPARVQIAFRDDGTGIAEHNLKRIFDPFFTTKMGQGGSGLGLNICYNIVSSLLNGKLTVNSTVGEGTVFTLDLPLEVEPGEQ
jgi:signal transduction histidine kinase